jgi:XRE family transcriptional regulator
MADMPSKPPIVFPQEQRVLTAMGERIRLARRRRRLSTTTVSGRAGISRSTLHKIEAGDPGVTLGSCVRVLACLSLVNDFDHIAADDRLGRRLQDLGLEPPPRPKRKGRPGPRRAVEGEGMPAGELLPSGQGKDAVARAPSSKEEDAN